MATTIALLYNIVPKKKKKKNEEGKECTSVMYTIVYTKHGFSGNRYLNGQL